MRPADVDDQHPAHDRRPELARAEALLRRGALVLPLLLQGLLGYFLAQLLGLRGAFHRDLQVDLDSRVVKTTSADP